MAHLFGFMKVSVSKRWGPLVLISGWYLLGVTGIMNEIYFPRLEAVVISLWFELQHIETWTHIGFTIYRTLIAFGLASFFGVGLGLVLGIFPKIGKALDYIIDFFRSLPAPALFPVSLLLFGVGEMAGIMVAAFMIFWIILVYTISGIEQSKPIRTQVAEVFRASQWQRIGYVTLPESLPAIMTGLRISLPLSLMLIVVAEMFLGGANGLGQKLF